MFPIIKIINYKNLYVIILLLVVFSAISSVKSQENNKKCAFEFCDDVVILDLPIQYNYYNYTNKKCKYFNISFNISLRNITLLEVYVDDAERYDKTDLSHIIESVKTLANPNMDSIDCDFSIDSCNGVFQFGFLPMQDLQPREQQILGRKPKVYVVQYLEPCDPGSKWKRLITVRSYLNDSSSLLHSFKLKPKWEN